MTLGALLVQPNAKRVMGFLAQPSAIDPLEGVTRPSRGGLSGRDITLRRWRAALQDPQPLRPRWVGEIHAGKIRSFGPAR